MSLAHIIRIKELIRGGSRAVATSKMERFVIIINGWKLNLGCCNSPSSASDSFSSLLVEYFFLMFFFSLLFYFSLLFIILLLVSSMFTSILPYLLPLQLKNITYLLWAFINNCFYGKNLQVRNYSKYLLWTTMRSVKDGERTVKSSFKGFF